MDLNIVLKNFKIPTYSYYKIQNQFIILSYA